MLLLLALACKDGVDTPADSEPELLSPLEDALCARVRAGAPGTGDPLVALSEAHAALRLFGFAASFHDADAALIEALRADPPDLVAYEALAAQACLLDAVPDTLGEAEVSEREGSWWVVPGTGTVTVPDDGAPVIVDLRGLPWTEELEPALRTAFAASLSAPLTLPSRRVRAWDGYVDQVYSQSNAYSVSTELIEGEQLEPRRSGGALFVLTDATPSPPVATWAGAVALGGAGQLVGRPILAVVAESSWSPIGDQGLIWRSSLLLDETDAWPDRIEVSLETDAPERHLDELGSLSAPERGDIERDRLPSRQPWLETTDPEESEATLRADLMIVHGTLRRFYPYFDVMGDHLDERLQELWGEEFGVGRHEQIVRLGRLGETLHDGHCYFGHQEGDPSIQGYFAALLDHIDGRPVVVRTSDPAVLPGDTVTALNGEPIEDVYAALLAWNGAATEGYAYDLAGRAFVALQGPSQATLLDPDGVERTVDLTLAAQGAWALLGFAVSERANGLLTELGHPEIGYLNLDGAVTTGVAAVDALLDQQPSAIIVDMRGYPGANHYDLLGALLRHPFDSPIFHAPHWSGPDLFSFSESQYLDMNAGGSFSGPIVLLVGPRTVSAAENFSQMLVGSGRLSAVVGRPSAGTNGNITGLRLPGGYYFSFTGMQILNPDGSAFAGIGIQPTLEVIPAPADYRDGRDPELAAAIALLGGP